MTATGKASEYERCEILKKLDRVFETSKKSPLHHDNRRCPIHNPEGPKPPLEVIIENIVNEEFLNEESGSK